MSTVQAWFEANNRSILQIAAEALTKAPHLTAAQTAVRHDAVMRAILALRPTEPSQTMLAALTVGYQMSILDTFEHINRVAMAPLEVTRALMSTVNLGKTMLGMMGELRAAHRDATAAFAAERAARQDAAARVAAEAEASAEDERAAFEAAATEPEIACSQTLAAAGEASALNPDIAVDATGKLDRTIPAAPAALSAALTRTPAGAAVGAHAAAGQVTGSRAYRRAMMKQRGRQKII